MQNEVRRRGKLICYQQYDTIWEIKRWKQARHHESSVQLKLFGEPEILTLCKRTFLDLQVLHSPTFSSFLSQEAQGSSGPVESELESPISILDAVKSH